MTILAWTYLAALALAVHAIHSGKDAGLVSLVAVVCGIALSILTVVS